MRVALSLPSGVLLLCVLLPAASAQERVPGAQDPEPDSLRLGVLQEQAVGGDPRQRQIRLLADQSQLRLRNLAAEWLPDLTGEARAQVQSDVVEIPIRLPDGQRLEPPPQDTYDTYLDLRQRILDPEIAAEEAVERTRLAESQARVRATLFALRQEVNESFFTAALLQARVGEIQATTADLEARLRATAARVREGAALPSEAETIEAALLQRRQDEATLRADRRAALAVLAELTGRRVDDDDALALPDLAAAVGRARDARSELRARPEYERFGRTRERLRREEERVAARSRPRLSAFGRAGYGRPGLDFLSNRFDEYWRVGIQAEWLPWTWGKVDREREALAIERQIVAADEAAFSESLERAVPHDLAEIDRLEAALVLDERIIELRERIEHETRLRFQEGVVTAAEYVDRNTDLLEARLQRAAHRVELAHASARFLTTLGLELP